jgi:hypothetical protein
MDLREIAWVGVGWRHLAQDRDQWRAVVNTKKVGNFFTSCVTISFSRRTVLHGVNYFFSVYVNT